MSATCSPHPHNIRKERRTAAKLKVGDVIYTRDSYVITPDGERLYYWCTAPDANTPDQEVFATSEHHGPFKSKQEAEKDKRAVLLGEHCKVEEGGMWDPAWNKPQ
jgi:hypothetical protein